MRHGWGFRVEAAQECKGWRERSINKKASEIVATKTLLGEKEALGPCPCF